MRQVYWKQEREKIGHFIKCGLFVLSVILIAGIGIYAKKNMKAHESALAAGSGAIKNTGKKLPIYCVECSEPKVALSFDAAWGNEDTANILKILKKYKIHVTFFMTGGWVSSYPDDVKAIAKAGHDLGNHSENHKQMSKLSAEECRQELMSVHEKVKELTGVEMKLFRPPYGDYNDNLVETANGIGYHVIQWDVDSLDWKDYGTESIINTVVNHKHLGTALAR